MNEPQLELIRAFMLAIAPQVSAHSLEIGADGVQNASVTLGWSMQLSARYHELYETLVAAPQDSLETKIQKGSSSGSTVHQAQARIPVEPSPLPSLPKRDGGGHSPQTRSQRDPLDPYA